MWSVRTAVRVTQEDHCFASIRPVDSTQPVWCRSGRDAREESVGSIRRRTRFFPLLEAMPYRKTLYKTLQLRHETFRLPICFCCFIFRVELQPCKLCARESKKLYSIAKRSLFPPPPPEASLRSWHFPKILCASRSDCVCIVTPRTYSYRQEV